MKKRGPEVPGILLALCVLLNGCAVPEIAHEFADAPAPESVAAPAPIPDSIPGRAAGIMEDEILLTIDGRNVPAWEYLYWLSLACDRARGQASNAVDWESVAEQALMNTALYASVETLAERYGVADASDADALSERWERRCAAYGGEAAYLNEIARYGLDRPRAETLFRVGALYGKLRELCKDGGALSPSDADLKALEKEVGTVQVDRILCDGADRNAARRRAEALFERLNGAKNQAALFSDLTWEGSDHIGPRALKSGTFDEGLERVARALQIGQLSGIIESGDGFSILRRLPPERDSLLEIWLRRSVEETARGADVELTRRCLEIDPQAFSTALDAARQASET